MNQSTFFNFDMNLTKKLMSPHGRKTALFTVLFSSKDNRREELTNAFYFNLYSICCSLRVESYQMITENAKEKNIKHPSFCQPAT